MNVLFGLFLIAHGWIHYSYLTPRPPWQPGAPKWPFELARSWLLAPMGLSPAAIKIIGMVLVMATVAGFTLAGLSWLGVPGLKALWIPLVVVSSITSLLVLVLYFNLMLAVGLLINAALLYFVLARGIKPV